MAEEIKITLAAEEGAQQPQAALDEPLGKPRTSEQQARSDDLARILEGRGIEAIGGAPARERQTQEMIAKQKYTPTPKDEGDGKKFEERQLESEIKTLAAQKLAAEERAKAVDLEMRQQSPEYRAQAELTDAMMENARAIREMTEESRKEKIALSEMSPRERALHFAHQELERQQEKKRVDDFTHVIRMQADPEYRQDQLKADQEREERADRLHEKEIRHQERLAEMEQSKAEKEANALDRAMFQAHNELVREEDRKQRSREQGMRTAQRKVDRENKQQEIDENFVEDQERTDTQRTQQAQMGGTSKVVHGAIRAATGGPSGAISALPSVATGAMEALGVGAATMTAVAAPIALAGAAMVGSYQLATMAVDKFEHALESTIDTLGTSLAQVAALDNKALAAGITKQAGAAVGEAIAEIGAGIGTGLGLAAGLVWAPVGYVLGRTLGDTLGKTVGQAVDAIQQLDRAVAGTAQRLSQYDGGLAQQQAEQEVRDIMRDISRAQRFGTEIAEANAARFSMEQKLSDIGDRLLPLVMGIAEKLFSFLDLAFSEFDKDIKDILRFADGVVLYLRQVAAAFGMKDVKETLTSIHKSLLKAQEEARDNTTDAQWMEFFNLGQGFTSGAPNLGTTPRGAITLPTPGL